MVASRFIITGFVAAASASALVAEDEIFATLLKRQEPGTPAYNCHDNCGTAITVSKSSSDVCKDQIFLNDYKNCLQCAGTDNYNIWRYYGGTLSTVASGCGLSTEPLSGKQPDVPVALHPGDSVASSAAPESPSGTPAPTEAPPTSGATPAPTSDDAPTPTSGAPVSTGGEEVPASTSAPGEPSVPSSVPVVAPSVTLSSVSSGVPVPSGNGTASFTVSAPPQQSTNAAVGLDVSNAGMFGAVVMGVMYGLGN